MSRTTPPPRGDEANLYARHADLLLRIVSRRASAPQTVIEDACAVAWTQLLRYQPERDRVVAWLVTVATREAWTLAKRESRETSIEALGTEEGTEGAYAMFEDLGATLEDQLDAREALRAVASLPERQRHALSRQLAGLSYEEMAVESGESRRTVERQLMRAHKHIREGGEKPDSAA